MRSGAKETGKGKVLSKRMKRGVSQKVVGRKSSVEKEMVINSRMTGGRAGRWERDERVGASHVVTLS